MRTSYGWYTAWSLVCPCVCWLCWRLCMVGHLFRSPPRASVFPEPALTLVSSFPWELQKGFLERLRLDLTFWLKSLQHLALLLFRIVRCYERRRRLSCSLYLTVLALFFCRCTREKRPHSTSQAFKSTQTIGFASASAAGAWIPHRNLADLSAHPLPLCFSEMRSCLREKWGA